MKSAMTDLYACSNPAALPEDPQTYSSVSYICTFAYAVPPAGEILPPLLHVINFSVFNTLLKHHHSF